MRIFSRRREPLAARFYNLRVGRPNRRVALEVRALLAARPAVLGLVEALGYDLPEVNGYVLLRDRSTRSRANVAAYARADLFHEGSERWHDLETRWLRTEHPGVHEPRSFLEFRAAGVQVVVYHAPPQGIRDPDTHEWITAAAQTEGINAVARCMSPWTRRGWTARALFSRLVERGRSRVMLADINRQRGVPGPGSDSLAEAIDGVVAGTSIDVLVGRRVAVAHSRYMHVVAGVTLLSDHHHALHVDLLVKRRMR